MPAGIRGIQQLAALSKRLKDLGDKDLEKEFSKSISAATRPMIIGLRQSARETLPKHGGLNERIAKSTIRTVKTVRAGVRIVAKNSYDLDLIDKGRVRHPVFGHRDRWVEERVTPGWWSKPIELGSKSVEVSVRQAMEAIKKKLDARL